MKKADSTSNDKDLKAEVKRLQKQVAQLESQNKKFEDKIAKQKSKLSKKDQQLKKEDRQLKKRRAEKNADKRATRFDFEAIPRHRFSLLIVQLSILIYTQTNCGLRTVVAILEIISKCFGGKLGKVPCYNTVENWVRKLRLSVYEEDRKTKSDQKGFRPDRDEVLANGQEVYCRKRQRYAHSSLFRQWQDYA